MSQSRKKRPTDIVGLSSSAGSINNSTSTATIKLTPNVNPSSFMTPADRENSIYNVGQQSGMPSTDRLSKMFWQAKHKTIAYCFVFWGFGMCVAFLGPTLLDLSCETGSVFSTMSWVFFAQSLFILIGSAVAGFVTQRFPVNAVLFVCTLMLALTLAIIPLCKVLALLALVLAIMGFFMGTIDTVANVSMIAIYGKSVAPFLQALHFFYGLGAFVSPMIAEPFLLNQDCTPLIDNSSAPLSSHLTRHLDLNDDDEQPARTLAEAQKMSKIDYAFWIMALLQIPVIVMVSTLLMKQIYDAFVDNSTDESKPKEQYENVEMDITNKDNASVHSLDGDDDHPPATKSQIYAMTILTALLLFLYDGLQAAYGGYIFSYAKKNVANMTASEAAYLNAYFWGTFAFGRLISIIVATKMTPGVMLFCNICGCIFSMFLMLILSHSRTALYFGTCMFGFFLSSVYPTAFALAEQFIKVTSIVTSCIVVGAATGEMMLPVIVGHGVDWSPINFLISGFVVTLFSLFVYGAIWVVGGTILKQSGLLGALLSLMSANQADNGEDAGLVSGNVKYYSRMRHDSESSLGGNGQGNGTGSEAYVEAIEINHEEYSSRQ